MQIIDADREAAETLRVLLADICGFWHVPGDEGPLTIALARHRIAAEQRTAERLRSIKPAEAVPCKIVDISHTAPVPAVCLPLARRAHG